MATKKEETKVNALVEKLNSMTQEERVYFLEGIAFADETKENSLPRLNFTYPIMKQPQTTLGDGLKQGTVFVQDGDTAEPVAYAEGFRGLAILNFKDRVLVNEGSNIPECQSSDMINGTKYGSCLKCTFSKSAGDKAPSACNSSFKLVLVYLDPQGELKLAQIKAKGMSYSALTTTWQALTNQARGQISSFILNVSSRLMDKKDKDGKDRKFFVWDAKLEEKISLTPEAKTFLADTRTTISKFQREKQQLLTNGTLSNMMPALETVPEAPALPYNPEPGTVTVVNEDDDIAI